MSSLRSRLLNSLLKNRHRLPAQSIPTRITGDTDIDDLRQKIETRAARSAHLLPSSISFEQARFGQSEWVRHRDATDHRALLYFHGGGYVLGTCKAHRGMVGNLVHACRVNALCFDYRRAPENPFPAALDDALQMWDSLLAAGHAPGNVVFAGDSAGGGLLLSTLLAIKARSTPMPAAAVMLSPWVDLTCRSASYSKPDAIVPEGTWQVFAHYYAGETALDHPLVSPLFGDLQGLPPLYLNVGDDENLFDEVSELAKRAKTAGVEVDFEIGAGQFHCYPLLSPFLPESRQSLERIARFIRGHLA